MSVSGEIVADAGPTVTGLDALRTSAGWAPLTDTGWIAVTGSDRVRWLNGMVTNSVQALTPGEGAYFFLLNAQGRIQGDGTVWCETDRLLVETGMEQAGPMMALLDRFIIMDDVELQDESAAWHGLQIAGPDAVDVLGQLGIATRSGRLLKRNAAQRHGTELHVVAAYSPVVPRFEIWASTAETLSAFSEELSAIAAECTPQHFDALRLIEGTPRFGTDIRDRDLPQETGQARALHFNKGCYLGQEIVERIRSRGQVHRTFASFALLGETPDAGAELQAEGKPVGVLTSISKEPIDGKLLALGYIRRESLERGAALTYPEGTAEARVPRSASNSQKEE